MLYRFSSLAVQINRGFDSMADLAIPGCSKAKIPSKPISFDDTVIDSISDALCVPSQLVCDWLDC